MARLARSVVLGYPHAVCQQANPEQTVFEEDADYHRYIGWLRECVERYGLDIWAYCLMSNHVHYICVPRTGAGLSRTFNTVHMKYAQYFHKKKGLNGQLWKGRFRSCPLDDPSVFEEVRFIENDPVRSGLVARAEEYPWSSARHHVLGEPDPVLRDACFLMGEVSDWRAYLTDRGDESVLNRTWHSLKTGRPSGDAGFVHALEEILGRKLGALPRGRPKKILHTT